MRMTVFGTGYLGATHAACMAELGHEVLGVDVDPAKIDALSKGVLPFYEPGLSEILQRNLANGRLRFTNNYAEAAQFAHIHFIGVGTPQKKGSYAADTQYVHAVVKELSEHIDTLYRSENSQDNSAGEHLIFGKSTVPVGTAAQLQQQADEALKDSEASITIAWNPEFLREGHAVKDTISPDRIVLGVPNDKKEKIENIAKEVYADALNAGTPMLSMDIPTAELVKVSANAFLATKISFINAVSEICETVGADVTRLAEAIGMDDRIGPKFLGAGLGFGGGCLPKDIRAFMARAGELGADQALTFLREVDAINMRRREKTVDIARQTLGGSLIGRNITVLGAAFKPHSDDVRDSPALSVAGSLSLGGAAVTVYDPEAMANAAKLFPTLTYAGNCREALEGAELVIVATEWQEFRELDPYEVQKIVAQPYIIDGRNCLARDTWIEAGWNVHSLGRG